MEILGKTSVSAQGNMKYYIYVFEIARFKTREHCIRIGKESTVGTVAAIGDFLQWDLDRVNAL